MRLAYGLLVSTLLVSSAHAADYLRGTTSAPSYSYGAQPSQPSYDWTGVYFGGFGSWSSGDIRDGGAATNLATVAFPNLNVTAGIANLIDLPERRVRGAGYGGFVGYNTQWDDVVLGVEAEYSRVGVDATSTMPAIRRQLPSGSRLADVNLTSGSQKMKLDDYGVARVRAGWAYGRFMPYISVGLAIGRVSRVQSLNGTVQEYELIPIVDALGNITGYNRINYGTATANYNARRTSNAMGYAIGAGLDYAVTDNIFVRGKYEYISLGGNNSLSIGMHTAKAGIGAKF